MLLTNEFVVHRPLEETWAVLTDLERIAPCMPGAQLTSVQGDDYHGKVKVKVGPMTAQFSGVATFKERDAAAHRAVIDARGRDATGKGRASALVTAVLAAEGDATKVTVETDLTIAGPLAQMGRSTIGDISTRLLGQFVANLEQQLAETPPAPAASPAETSASTPAGAGQTETLVATPAAAPAETLVNTPATATAPATAPAPATATAPAPATAPAETLVNTPAGATPTQTLVNTPAGAEQAVRVIDGPEAAPVNLLETAGTGNLIKIAIPVVVLVAAIVALVVWLV